MTKLASKLPEGGHGLETISHLLVSRPHERHVVIGVVDCSTVTTNHDNGSVEPQARFRRVEVINETDDLFKYGRARRILQLAREAFDRNDQEG